MHLKRSSAEERPLCPVGDELIQMELKAITYMMTSSNKNNFRVTGHFWGEFTVPGEFPAQRPVTRNFDVFSDLRLNKQLSKQSWGWWFEKPLSSLCRHSNGILYHVMWLPCNGGLAKPKLSLGIGGLFHPKEHSGQCLLYTTMCY